MTYFCAAGYFTLQNGQSYELPPFDSDHVNLAILIHEKGGGGLTLNVDNLSPITVATSSNDSLGYYVRNSTYRAAKRFVLKNGGAQDITFSFVEFGTIP